VWSPDAARRGDDAALDALAARLDGARALVNLAGASISAGRLDAPTWRACAAAASTWRDAAGGGAPLRRPAGRLGAGVGRRPLRRPRRRGPHRGVGPGAASFPLVPTGLAWEAAADPAADLGRLVVARLGVVLDRDAEAWRRLLLPVRLFAGGPLGSGRQWMAWISGRDAARALVWLLDAPDAHGVYNLTAPEPVRQIDLTRTAARRCGGRCGCRRRPSRCGSAGRTADGLLLGSQRVVPQRLLEAGFAFEDPTIEGPCAADADVRGRSRRDSGRRFTIARIGTPR
jgi:uncharacterized protein